ncbi:olfactory receptor 4 [Bombyx mori]|uniref:Odorant receptor n=2 Tax=Bombyx mori TaxID=7091 RepID=Q5FBD9_BOMMO|nr:olfactory receptor 4 [Bombyx mori]BAD89568.1 olfactory receptor-like receptor [Bombyx mori]
MFKIIKNIIVENDALKQVEKPQEFQYMKWVQYHLKYIDGWPNMDMNKKNVSKIRFHKRHLLVVEQTITFLSQMFYIVKNYGKLSFFEIGHSYITALMTIVIFSRSVVTALGRYRKIARYFVSSLHLYHYKDISEYALQTHLLVHRLSHYYTVYLISLVVTGMLLFNITPLYNNISSGVFNSPRPENMTFQHAVYLGLPFDYTTDIKGYFVVFILNWHLSHIAASYFCTFDLFLSLLILHLWGHLRIILNNLKTFPKPYTNNSMYTEEENQVVLLKLQECIRYHNFIISFTVMMSNVYDVVIIVYYLFHQVTGCLLLLQCSTLDWESLSRYGPLTLIIFQQLIQVSMIFEILGFLSDKLPNAVYSIPWEAMNVTNRKLVQVLLQKSQKPIQFKAMNMMSVGVQTMASIIKTSISYFIMLRTIARD